METTQKLGADYRMTLPSSIRKIMGAEIGDYITFDVKAVVKNEDR